MRVTKSKKKTKSFSSQKITKYLPVMIILLSLTIILGSTFAYFTDKVDRGSDLTFSKVELSNETTVGIDGALKDALPGSPIVEERLQFSKSIDSEAIYVRAKLSFSIDPSLSDSDKALLNPYVTQLREADEFGVKSEVQNNAKWSARNGNYFYLLDSTTNNLKVVDDTYIYVLSDSIILPRSLKQLEDNAQYMKSINFHIAFQAVQVSNLSTDTDTLKEIFNELFPETPDEKIPTHVITYMGEDLQSVYQSQEVIKNKPLEELLAMPQEAGLIFEGWFLDKDFEVPYVAGEIINSDVILYPKTKRITSPAKFTFDGSKLTKYIGTDTNVIIPDSYSIAEDGTYTYGNDIPITEIGSQAFKDDFVETLTIPEGITKISTYALGSTNLKTLYYNAINVVSSYSVTSSCFNDCGKNSNGVTMIVGDKVEIIPNYFACGYEKKHNIKKVEFIEPSSCTTIGADAFYYCGTLEEITIPASVTKILDDTTFAWTYNLLEMINHSSLKITIGTSSIGNYGLIGEYTLGVVDSKENSGKYYYKDGDTIYKFYLQSSGNMYLYDVLNYTGTDIVLPSAGLVLTHEYVEDKTVTLGQYSLFRTFMNEDITSVQFNEDVINIGAYTFNNCANLTTIDIAENVTFIGKHAYDGCIGVTTINFNAINMSNIEEQTYDSNTFKDVGTNTEGAILNIGENVERLPASLFRVIKGDGNYDVNVVEVNFGENPKLTSIGAFALSFLTGLESITIPKTVTDIGKGIFSHCEKLSTIKVEEGNPYYIDDGCNGIIDTRTNTLIAGCKDTIIPNYVTTINTCTFYNLSSLTTIDIPDSVITIGSYAFYGTGLTSVTIPKNMKKIESAAFCYCYYIESVYFNAVNMNNMSSNNQSFRDIGHKVTGGAIAYIGKDVKRVPNYLFECLYDYYYSPILTKIVFEEGSVCEEIGAHAFSYIDELESVENLPNTLKTIGAEAFRKNIKMKTITIPSSVTSFGKDVFLDCFKLETIFLEKGQVEVNETFNNIGKPIYYKGSEAEWKATTGYDKVTLDVYFYENGCVHDLNKYWAYDENGKVITDLTTSELIIDVAPTCQAEGSAHATCSVCSGNINIILSKIQHTEENGVCTMCHQDVGYTLTFDETYPFVMENPYFENLYINSNHGVKSTTSSMMITATANITISFTYKVSSESSDKLILAKNGSNLYSKGGEVYYTEYTVTLSAGDVFTISYKKDGSVNTGDDTVYIKDLIITKV